MFIYSQGHVNDTIVVNQPRLTTDEDFIRQATDDVQVEMSMLDGNHPKWHNDPALDENVTFIYSYKYYIKLLK